jgi:amino acid adenylation domain-containing protein
MAIATPKELDGWPSSEIEQSIAARFEQQVARFPDNLALSDERLSLTYAELNRYANRIANSLTHVAPGRVVVCIENGAQCVAAILGVLKAGHAYVPVDPAFPESRNAYIVEDVQAGLIVTNQRNLATATSLAGGTAQIINVDALAADTPDTNPTLTISPDALAWIIYTSGSTGKPKGVMQNQRGTLHGWMRRTRLQRVTPTDRMTLFYSCSVMGSVYCIFGSLLNGAALFPYDFREQGVDELAAWLHSRRITVYHSVASVFRQFATHYQPGSTGFSVRLVTFGGERVLTSDVELARGVFGRNVEFYTGLGSTETGTIRYFYIGPDTVLKDAVVPIGYPVDGMDIVLLDDAGKPVGPGQVGEITVRSRYLALGYWNNPEATAKVFRMVPGDSTLRAYHMGDMGELRADGLLQHRGRKDFQVKIRGFRVEVGEVETVLLEHAAIKEVVVMARDIGSETHLVAYLVAAGDDAEISVRQLRQRLQKRLPYYMVPTVYVRLEAMPRTPNNKVDRLRLPDPTRENSLLDDVRVEPVDDLERGLLEICSDLLRVEAIGTNHNFFDLGGHSLSATQLVARVQQRFGVKLGMRQIFEAADLKAIAAQIRATAPTTAAAERTALVVAARDTPVPPSFAQRRMWFIDALNQGNSAYNISNTVRLEGPLDITALRRALSAIVERHESLRTRFPTNDAGPYQEVLPATPVALPESDLSSRPAEQREIAAQALVRQVLEQHHDLSQGPLFHSSLIRLGPESAILVLAFNHIVYDNIWSSGIFFRELAALYQAFTAGKPSPLQPLRFQFADYAAWEHARSAQGGLRAHMEYWKKQLANLPPPLQVPGDFLRPDTPSLKGGQVAFQLPATLSSALTDFARAEASTNFMALLACWQLLLHRYTQQNDILVGTPTGRRYLAETEDMIGLFINNLVLRTDFSAAPTFRQLLTQVRHTTIDAFTHDELPFEDLVAELRPARTSGVSPLFQHLFIHRNATHSKWELPGLKLTPYHMHVGGSKFDLTLSMLEEGAQISGTLEYSSDLFTRETAERIASHFVTLLGSALEAPDRPVAQLEMLGRDERNALLYQWNPPATAYPSERTHELFEHIAARHPEAIAVIGESHSLSYAELNQRANRLAVRLRDMGVGPDQLVAVCLDRSPELIIALLAVLKAGGAYVPLDPLFPPDRLKYMVEDAQARICISQAGVIERLQGLSAEVVLIERDSPLLTAGDAANPGAPGSQDDLAYVIYTSGSTGRPKGVQVTQRGLVNFLVSMQREPGITRDDVVHTLTTVCFDIAGLEIFLPLITGARLVIKPQTLALDPLKLIASLKETGTTLMQATPVTWRMMLDNGWRGDPKMKILCGGEAMTLDLAEKLIASGCEVWNMYGPTETTIWSSVRQVRVKSDAVNLGLPIANTEFLICSPEMGLLPVGVPGELLIGGDGLARGYFRREDITREKFVPHPFAPQGRLYRTGDLATRRSDGSIEFLGRIDHQVKIRGFRIELGEIENQLLEDQRLAECCCMVHTDPEGDKQIVAYYRSETALDPGELRAFLAPKLPSYMVPNYFMHLKEFPKTANQKIDRKQLPAPTFAQSVERDITLKPISEVERKILAVWQKALKGVSIDVEDDFFDLGGHSLIATQVIAEMNRTIQPIWQVKDLFVTPSIRGLAQKAPQQGRYELPLVFPVQLRGKKKPFFLVAGVYADEYYGEHGQAEYERGFSRYFSTIVNVIGRERPIYGLRARGMFRGEKVHDDIVSMADEYIREIKKICPQGPYILGGECLGGNLAYEVAQRMKRAGDEVSLVVLMDTRMPSFRSQWSHKLKYLARVISKRIKGERVRLGTRSADYAAKLTRYRVDPYDGNVLLVANEEWNARSERLAWDPRVVPKLSVEIVKGDHASRLREHGELTGGILSRHLGPLP